MHKFVDFAEKLWYNIMDRIILGPLLIFEDWGVIVLTDGRMQEIAVIVAGIDEEYQISVLEGINKYATENSLNISYFTAFGGVMTSSFFDIGEYNIYELINYDRFDGFILMTNTINDQNTKERIISNVIKSGRPAVVFDCSDYPEFYNISIDNSGAMQEIVRHIIDKHNARTINYVSGPLSNPEAKSRYDAFLSVMKEHDIAVDPERIYFGEFRAIDGINAVESFITSGLSMPDAIICANDAMGIAVVMALERYGYDIPKDIMVTGFDNTYTAKNYSPALTSVSRPLKEAGVAACEILMRISKGEMVSKNNVLRAEPVFSESCGCPNHYYVDFASYKKSSLKHIESCRTDISLLNRMTSELAETEDVENNIKIIGKYMCAVGCEQFAVCLCSEWDANFLDRWSDGSADYQVHGYTKTMSAPLVWNKGNISSVESFYSEDMFPVKRENGGNVSYFLPLHFRERCLGYYVLTNGNFPIRSLLCHSMMMNISNSIENIRKLIHLNSVIDELDKLYVVDPLCGIYNRNGFIRNADAIFRQCEAQGTPVIISFIDMDGLKYINDNFGHKEGDFALQSLAQVINECSKDDMICARFGGDEFIIFGTSNSENDAEKLERSFLDTLSRRNAVVAKPYDIDASIGTIVTKIEEGTKLFTLITQADKLMYERKKKKKTSRYLRK